MLKVIYEIHSKIRTKSENIRTFDFFPRLEIICRLLFSNILWKMLHFKHILW